MFFCLYNKGRNGNPLLLKKIFPVLFCFIFLCLVFKSGPAAAGDAIKRTLQNNMKEKYHVLPEKADTVRDIFKKSMVYGRIRTNYFWCDRTDESDSAEVEIDGEKIRGIDPTGFAVGGSLIYKTAPFKGLSATLGYYVAHNLGLIDEEDVAGGKSGKDTFDRRRDTDRAGNTDYSARNMYVPAQSFLQYNFGKTEIRTGRQIFESFLTASNDTKMIPNTFLGTSIVNKDLPGTILTAGWFNKQKLRDHVSFHDVVLYDGWHENDDSGVHIRYTRENGGDSHNDLVVLGVVNHSVPDMRLDFWYTGVPGLFYSTMYEANYTFRINDDLSITPGCRYFRQYDDGLDDVTLKGLSASQKDAFNKDDKINGRAEAYFYALRLVANYKNHKFALGYHKNSDKGDVVAPWRGHPTRGYTRTMTEVNWAAGTESKLINWTWKINDAFRYSLSWAHNGRRGRNTETTVFLGEFWYSLTQNIEIKTRLMHHDGWGESDFDEARIEVNCLF